LIYDCLGEKKGGMKRERGERKEGKQTKVITEMKKAN